ncbi:MAG: amidoligase family protein [SAR324 cluster bacterium]|nr:amidoligase family protein [SAR324 cluster bacterium]
METSRTYGIEIECLSTLSHQALAALITEAGVPCQQQGYNHNTTTCWKIVNDGSVMGSGYSTEVVSPVLSGEEGLRQIEIVCRVLGEAGCTINRSCGLHVHHDARDFKFGNWKRLVKAYAKFEDVLDSFMPESRRKNNNTYCRSAVIGTLGGLCEKVNQQTNYVGIKSMIGTRYVKLNVESFLRHGTVEFRHHSGTMDFDKIANWIKVTQAMVEMSHNPHKDYGYGSSVRNTKAGTFGEFFKALNLSDEIKGYYKNRVQEVRRVA